MGDYVAVASTAWNSPQLVFGEVISLSDADSKGDPVMGEHYDSATSQWSMVQSCNVRVRVLSASRLLNTRSGTRNVTFKFPENIIKIDRSVVPAGWLDTDQEPA